jgi:hypothetical protein
MPNIEFGQINEADFYGKYHPFVLLNAVCQAMEIGYKEFTEFAIKHENKIPSSFILNLLNQENLKLIKYLIDNKITIFDIDTNNKQMFESDFTLLTFLPLTDIPENFMIVKEKVCLPKHVLYYLYKTKSIGNERRLVLLKELQDLFLLTESDILIGIIKMKDQELAS